MHSLYFKSTILCVTKDGCPYVNIVNWVLMRLLQTKLFRFFIKYFLLVKLNAQRCFLCAILLYLCARNNLKKI